MGLFKFFGDSVFVLDTLGVFDEGQSQEKFCLREDYQNQEYPKERARSDKIGG